MKKIMISLSTTKAAVRELEKLLYKATESYTNAGTFLKLDMSKWPNTARLMLSRNIPLKVNSSGLTTITDALFDKMMDVLREENPASVLFKKVGAPVPSTRAAGGKDLSKRLPKVALKHYMGSLYKIKPESADTWLNSHPGPYVVSNKKDGVSIQLNYVKGQPPKAYTRGNGSIGQDISKLVPHLNIPQKLNRDMDIRGEIIMKEAAFKSKWSKEFENARNLVAGLVNRKAIHPAIKDIDVIVYEVISPRGVPSTQLNELKGLGFHVVTHNVFKTVNAAQLSTLLIARKLQSNHAIDGLVVAQDIKTSATTGTNPEHSVAFKKSSDEDIAVVKVKEVVWTSSKQGLLKPRVNIEPIRLAGVTINYATGFNASFIETGYRNKDKKNNLPPRPLGPGALVKITRSGDVIPHIIEVVKPAKKPQMPTEAYTWNKTHTDIIQTLKSELSAKKRVVYFFSKLDVEGLKMGTVSKLFDAGIDTILKIVKAPKSTFLSIDGIQDRTAEKLRSNIDQALQKMTLPALMDASGMFGALGEKRLTLILKKYPEILSRDADASTMHDLILSVPGFKTTLAMQFVKGISKFNLFYTKLGVRAQAAKVVTSKGAAFKNQVVVFTGFRDAQMESKITEQGGTIGSAVNAKTTLLVVKDLSSASSKVDKAKQMGIKITSGTALKTRLEKL